MINPQEIMDGINKKIVEKCPACTIYVNVCPQDFQRPSKYIRIIDAKSEMEGRLIHATLRVGILSFTALDDRHDPNRLAITQGAAEVTRALLGEGIQAGGRYLPIDKVENTYGPGEADTVVTLEYLEDFEKEEIEADMMECVETAVQARPE